RPNSFSPTDAILSQPIEIWATNEVIDEHLGGFSCKDVVLPEWPPAIHNNADVREDCLIVRLYTSGVAVALVVDVGRYHSFGTSQRGYPRASQSFVRHEFSF